MRAAARGIAQISSRDSSRSSSCRIRFITSLESCPSLRIRNSACRCGLLASRCLVRCFSRRQGVLAYRSRNADPAYRADSLQTAAIEAALGIVLILLLGRSTRERLESLAASLPLAVVGFGALVMACFG